MKKSNGSVVATKAVVDPIDKRVASVLSPAMLVQEYDDELAWQCRELQGVQRQRAVAIKSRIMQVNRLRAIVAGELGYSVGLSESDRTAKFTEAAKIIDLIEKDQGPANFPFTTVVKTTLVGINSFLELQANLEKELQVLAKKLPVRKWIDHPNQTGVGLKTLGIIIGETGDLRNYANPGKVFRRLGCAPWEYNSQTLMGSTWRSGREGKLPAEEWAKFGYSPRRRSIAYLIGEGFVKQGMKKDDKDEVTWMGPYRALYEAEKQRAAEKHPEWTECSCGGTGKTAKGSKCTDCSGRGHKLLRCHRHAMLVATKLFLENLWRVWHGMEAHYTKEERRKCYEERLAREAKEKANEKAKVTTKNGHK